MTNKLKTVVIDGVEYAPVETPKRLEIPRQNTLLTREILFCEPSKNQLVMVSDGYFFGESESGIIYGKVDDEEAMLRCQIDPNKYTYEKVTREEAVSSGKIIFLTGKDSFASVDKMSCYKISVQNYWYCFCDGILKCNNYEVDWSNYYKIVGKKTGKR